MTVKEKRNIKITHLNITAFAYYICHLFSLCPGGQYSLGWNYTFSFWEKPQFHFFHLFLLIPSPISLLATICLFSTSMGLFLFYFVLLCQIPHISETTEYLSFSISHISLNAIPCRSTHVARNGKISLLFHVIFHCIYRYRHINR